MKPVNFLNGSRGAFQTFPSVTSESVIRNNGRRCNVEIAKGVTAAPYLKKTQIPDGCKLPDALTTAVPGRELLEVHQSQGPGSIPTHDTHRDSAGSCAVQISLLQHPLRSGY